MENLINDELETSSSDNETTGGSDNESAKTLPMKPSKKSDNEC